MNDCLRLIGDKIWIDIKNGEIYSKGYLDLAIN